MSGRGLRNSGVLAIVIIGAALEAPPIGRLGAEIGQRLRDTGARAPQTLPRPESLQPFTLSAAYQVIGTAG
ncbi:hypothetical protein VUR80DRAFT_9186 [Thermomyces stellatus]